MVRLGGPVFGGYESPEEWVRLVKKEGYRAAYCPVGVDADENTIQAYARAAQEADILIAEVGVWRNPLSPDEKERSEAIRLCERSLYLADRIGACCCVNVAGSRGPKWDGPWAEDLTEATFEMIVEMVRKLIDTVQPVRTCFTLETMPWMYPDSPDSYLRLIRAIDRRAFAAHLDPVNLINSPQLYFGNTALLRECFAKLGPYIRSCHAKDILLSDRLTVHLDEVRPGLGGLDYPTYLTELANLDREVPLMLEHLSSEAEYQLAAKYVKASFPLAPGSAALLRPG